MTGSGRKWAFLSNGITSAIESQGSIVWFPCPRFDAPSIFSEILDEKKGGSFSVKPESDYRLKTEYLEDTLTVKNTFSTAKGKLEIRDTLPIGICGIIRAYDSKVPFIADINPIFGYGRNIPKIKSNGNKILFMSPSSREGVELRIRGRCKLIGQGRVRIQPGKGTVSLFYSNGSRRGAMGKKKMLQDPSELIARTNGYWREQIKFAKKTKKYKAAYERSILTVLGLIYWHSGAIIAAPSTSLPEMVGQGRNWDYRYCWIRDTSYAVEALASIAYFAKARMALDFMLSLIDMQQGSFAHPLYAIDGGLVPHEETLDWLAGHLDSRPVRVGNAASVQVQLDVEGALMHALHVYITLSHDKSYAMEKWHAIRSLADWTMRSLGRKSRDIWEKRSPPRHFVHTKVMQWVALDRAFRIADTLGYYRKALEWKESAQKLRNQILKKGFSTKLKSFTQYYGSKEVDAALLTLPLYGFIDAKDPMFLSTLRRIEQELMPEPGLVMRYKSDFWGEAQNPFTLCSTWLARVYLRTGDRGKADTAIRKTIACSNELLLFGEHVDRKTKEPRGNFPQLFPHAGLLETLAEYNDQKLISL